MTDRKPWARPDVWLSVGLLVAAYLLFLAALVTAPILFAHWCIVRARPAVGVPLLITAALGAVLFCATLQPGRSRFRIAGLVLFLAPIMAVAAARALSSGDWPAEGGPALATLLVALWLGLSLSHHIEHRGRDARSPST